MSDCKIKLKLKSAEIEIEGNQEFVEKQIENLANIFELVSTSENIEEEEEVLDEILEKVDSTETDSEDTQDIVIPDNFGEWYHKFKSDISNFDKALVAGYFVQSNSSTKDFKTSEVNKTLKDHGIKLSSATVFINQLADKKLVFQTRKVGNLHFMRVSQEGLKHFKSIMQ